MRTILTESMWAIHMSWEIFAVLTDGMLLQKKKIQEVRLAQINADHPDPGPVLISPENFPTLRIYVFYVLWLLSISDILLWTEHI